MKQAVVNLRTAWRLFRSEETIETAAALALVVATLGPVAWKIHKSRQGGGR